jgi:hypothetical protein
MRTVSRASDGLHERDWDYRGRLACPCVGVRFEAPDLLLSSGSHSVGVAGVTAAATAPYVLQRFERQIMQVSSSFSSTKLCSDVWF